jgi:hypothetical protein
MLADIRAVNTQLEIIRFHSDVVYLPGITVEPISEKLPMSGNKIILKRWRSPIEVVDISPFRF